jgi:hypothetical protein
MNPYSMVGSGNGTAAAAALSARLASWHDAMVAHDRKIRAGRAEEVCDEECPHAEARTLWVEALEIFGDRAQELTFLRSRGDQRWLSAMGAIPSSDRGAVVMARKTAATNAGVRAAAEPKQYRKTA